MVSANWPDAEAVLAHYASLLRLFYESLEIGIPSAKAFFDVRNKPVDPSLFPNLVRYEVKEFLMVHGHHAEEEEAVFEQVDVPNNGLRLDVNGDVFRVLKADQNGEVPAARSRARRDYYNFNQEQLALDKADAHGYHYVVIWDVNGKFNLAGLRLAFPWSATATNPSVMRWIVDVPHPAVTIVPQVTAAPQPAEDLQIQLERQRETGTEGPA